MKLNIDDQTYCPNCWFDLKSLPKVYTCTACGYLYIKGKTTKNHAKSRYPWVANFWFVVIWLLIPVYSIYTGMYALTVDPNILYYFPDHDPMNVLIDSIILIVLGVILLVMMVKSTYRAIKLKFEIKQKGILWRVRRKDAIQFISWDMIERVILEDNPPLIKLEITVGSDITVPEILYSRYDSVEELHRIILAIHPKFNTIKKIIE